MYPVARVPSETPPQRRATAAMCRLPVSGLLEEGQRRLKL